MPDDSQQPIEAQVPPNIVATPGELSSTLDDDIIWWHPTWKDAARHIGWRWIFLTPAVLLLALLIGSVIFIPLRPLLLVLGGKMLLLVVAIAASMAGWLFRRAARARKEPFCIHCGYNLTGLPDDYRCPECGRPYNWRLIEEYRRDPQWFIERWKLHHRLPSADTPFDAGKISKRHKTNDGTS